jgi:hypothetical protein
MTEKELFDTVIDGLDSQDWEDTNNRYRYVVDNKDCCSDRRSPLGWILTDEEHGVYQRYSVSRISVSVPRLQEFGQLLFDLEKAWNSKEWRDNYNGFHREYYEGLKEYRRAAIYGVGHLRGLLSRPSHVYDNRRSRDEKPLPF